MIDKTTEAVTEIARTTGIAIESLNRFCSFFSNIMGESIDATCGMLADTLKYKRLERQINLVEKAEKLIQEKGLSNNFTQITPKLVLSIFHNASLEDDDQIHDLYAKLLVTAIDPEVQVKRTAFTEIIYQLEPIDVKILQIMYDIFKNKEKESRIGESQPPILTFISKDKIFKNISISDLIFWESLDNLSRLGLINSYPKDGGVHYDVMLGKMTKSITTYSGGYDKLCLTALGVTFARICNY